jgi:hypothetical protein
VIDYRLGPMVPVDDDNETQRLARRGMILRVLVGSSVHGTAIEGTDDRDEMGVCIEPPTHVIGLSQFKHYSFRTQPEGVCSGPGDLDLVVYGLRRYVGLAAQGNPTVLLPLFVPEWAVEYENDFGKRLRSYASLFVSKAAGERFSGYLHSQRQGLLGLRSGGSRNQGRADIREQYGFDTKFAGHMVRLGVQGVEFLTTGKITLPMPEPWLTWIRDLRVGKHTKEEALEAAEDLEHQIEAILDTSELPERPDRDRVNGLLVRMYTDAWYWT